MRRWEPLDRWDVAYKTHNVQQLNFAKDPFYDGVYSLSNSY